MREKFRPGVFSVTSIMEWNGSLDLVFLEYPQGWAQERRKDSVKTGRSLLRVMGAQGVGEDRMLCARR